MLKYGIGGTHLKTKGEIEYGERKQNQITIPKRKDCNQIRWENGVLGRDNYTCRLCGYDNKNVIIHIYHIKNIWHLKF